ncbi:PREDICTED: uncharacterized protein LOC106292307 [Brassica oleracea var. oleracea]|uniref:uncharacterized protein LOC106292307 n=1 Tax=Brassica oleracea var. oleracea TaxID=109376 RepID=UPI0006A7095E|nr:PREDICTED: uncharacterized protein LOC106292307 [Brassica oleracea var. oleracea]
MGKIRRLTPFCYHQDGAVGQLLDLPSKLARPSVVQGQSWGDVLLTESTFRSVSSLLKECGAYGVEFIITRPDQRPWTPPIGFQCVYESFFQKDSRLWFPIPRLVTSYCVRRDIAMTQLMIGDMRIAVALMVMAAEIDVSMSVRSFEELTQTQPKSNGLFAVQMRSGLHILTGHPSGTKLWQRSYFFVKANNAAFEDPPGKSYRVLWSSDIVAHLNTIGPQDTFWKDVPKMVVLNQQTWASFDRQRISCQQKRIAKVDWSPDVPCVTTTGKRMKLPLMGHIPKAYPSYSELLRTKLKGESFSSMTASEGEDAEPQRSLAKEAVTGGGDVAASDSVVERTDVSTADAPNDSPFVSDPDACAELVRRIRGGAHLMPETSKLAFPNGFIASAQADVVAAVRKNQLILDYELSLRRMASDFATAEATIESKDAEIEKSKRVAMDKAKEMIAERSRYHREHKQDAGIIKDLEGELEAARSKIDRLEVEKTEEAEKRKRTMDHERQVHRRELTSEMSCIGAAAVADRFDKFRRYMVDRDKHEEKLVLHSQAFGALDGLGMPEEWGMPVPKRLKDILSAIEAKFKEELKGVVVEDITDHDLTVSSLPRLERL